MDEISRQEKIEVDNESLDQEFNNTLVDLQMQGVDVNKIKGGKQGQQRVAEAVAMESANRLLTRRTLEKLKAIATGEYKPEPKFEEPVAETEAAHAKAESKPAKKESAKKPEKKEAKPSAKSASKSSKSGASKKTSKSTVKKSTSKK